MFGIKMMGVLGNFAQKAYQDPLRSNNDDLMVLVDIRRLARPCKLVE
jgi:hypothetical protein